MKALPENLSEFKRTPEFTEDTLPEGLQSRHTTPTGTWAKIIIIQGTLTYRILEPELEEIELSESQPGVIEPMVPHEVKLTGEVRFYVAFYR